MHRVFVGLTAAWTAGIAIVGAALLAPGCAGPRGVATDILDDGTTVHTLASIEIKVEGATKHYGFEEGTSIVEKRCVLDVRVSEKEGKEKTLELLLTYTGLVALNIEPGRSLEIVADLNSYVLSAERGPNRARDPSGRQFTESLDYPVSADVLIAMAEAEVLRVIVKGRDGDARGSFDEKDFVEFGQFVDAYVRPR